MANFLGTLLVRLALDATDFDKGLTGAASSLQSAGAKMQSLGSGLTMGLTLPLVGAAAAATALANDYNASLANIASLGVPTDRINEFKGAMQDLGIEVGAMPTELADGMYQVVSAFGDSSASLAILEINAKAAAAGLATTTEAINLTSAVTKGYGDTSAEAVQAAADLAFQTVKLGQTTFPELASSIGLVVPLAASLGVAQEELFGVMATGTGVTGSASQVATQLRGVLQSLMAPTKGMEALLAEMGYESGQAMLQQLGLKGTIDAVVDAAEKSGTSLQSYIGSIEGQTLALALAGPQATTFADKLAAMADVSGAVDSAFAAQTSGVNATGFTMEQAGVKAAVLAQKLGDGIAPALSKLLDMAAPVVDWLIELADWFANTDSGTQTWIVGLAGLAAALGPVLGILGTLASVIGGIIPIISAAAGAIPAIGAALAVLTGPVGLVVAAVAGLALAWTTDFMGMRTTIEGWMGDIGAAWPGFVEGLGQAWSDASNWMQDAWNNAGANLRSSWAELMDWIPTDTTDMYNKTKQVFDMFGAGLEAAFDSATATSQNIWAKFADVLGVDVETLNGAVVESMRRTNDDITKIWRGLTEWLDTSTASMRKAVETSFKSLNTSVTGIWSGLSGWIQSTWSSMSTTLDQGWTTSATSIQTAWSNLDSNIRAVWGSLMSWMPATSDSMGTAVAGAFDSLSTGITTATNTGISGIKNVWSGYTSWLKEAITQLNNSVSTAMLETVNRIKADWQDMANGVRGIFDTLSQNILNIWNNTLNAIRQAWENMMGFFGGVQNFIGGLIPGARMADAEADRMFMPMAAGAGTEYTINLTNNFYGASDSASVSAATKQGVLDALRQIGGR